MVHITLSNWIKDYLCTSHLKDQKNTQETFLSFSQFVDFGMEQV